MSKDAIIYFVVFSMFVGIVGIFGAGAFIFSKVVLPKIQKQQEILNESLKAPGSNPEPSADKKAPLFLKQDTQVDPSNTFSTGSLDNLDTLDTIDEAVTPPTPSQPQPTPPAPKPVCEYRLTIREGEFASDKCYSYNDYNDLTYYIRQYDSAVFSYEIAENRADATCDSFSDSFKEICEESKDEKEDLEKDIEKYEGIIKGLLNKGTSYSKF